MFEPFGSCNRRQLDRLDGDHNLYDKDLRPSLMMEAIKESKGWVLSRMFGKSKG